MLQSIRDKTQGWIAKLILGLVCLTFALWGIHNYFTGVAASDVAAKVNGTAINRTQLLSSLRQLQAQQADAMGANYNHSPALQKALQQQALNQLISNQLLIQQLAKLKLVTPDSILQQLLQQIPAFQEQGRFSVTRYQQLLEAQGLTSPQFLGELRQQIEMTQLQQGISYSNFALPTDVNRYITLSNETRDVGYILIPRTHFKPAAVSDAAIQAYYDSHQDDFMMPPTVQVAYVQLSLPALVNTLKKQGLSADKAQATAEKQFAQDSDKMTNLAYEQPTSLQPLVNSLPVTVQQTGVFSQTQENATGIVADPSFRAAAFGDDVYNQGYNSQVLTLKDNSQVVLRVINKKPAAVAPLDDVKASITQKLEIAAYQDAALQLAKSLAQSLALGQDGASVAKNSQLTWERRPAVTRHENGVNSLVLQQVFAIPTPKDPQKPSLQVLNLPDGDVVVVALYGIKPGDPASISPDERKAFTEQIAKGYGQVDFTLYITGLRDEAHIRTYPIDLSTDNP